MPLYPHATKKLIRPGSSDPPITVRTAILHVDAGNAYDLFAYFRDRSGGIESHFHIAKDGTCLIPSHRVLTASLEWVPGGTLQVGDALVGFDESGAHRRYRRAVVEAIAFDRAPVYAVVMEDERIIYTTGDHRWLTQRNERWCWRQTVNPSGHTLAGAKVPLLAHPWDVATDYESGWLAGILDGEGTLNRHHRMTFAQRPGKVLDRAIDYLIKHDVTHTVSQVKAGADCMAVGLGGPLWQRLTTLGRMQPSRLIPKVDPDAFGQMQKQPWGLHKVLAVYPVGEREIVRMQTSARTFLAEGYPMHNCFQYRDTTWQADANYNANDFAVSIETQGFEAGEWTTAQLDAIKALLTWLHHTHGIPLRRCAAPFDAGVGYHTLFGAPSAWTPVAKSCPGPDRKRQFHQLLEPWMRGGAPTPPPEDDVNLDDIINPHADKKDQLSVGEALRIAANASVRTEQRQRRLLDQGRSQTQRLARLIDDLPDGATKTEVRELLNKLDATIELVVTEP
ncbi:MAG: N-acetylmuramoyl-L-alanine amidase [Pseudonocardiaceae bacterium]